jgi:hypothetical protein
MKRILAVIIASQSLAGCNDECSSYSKYNCSEIEAANYNVYFYLPNGDEKSLGQAKGLRQCSAKANDFANAQGLPKKWVCCMVTESSECEEKHR